jgi:hypothetical protein
MLKSHINDYVTDRIRYIISHLKSSTPGKRLWVQSDKYSSGYDYNVTIRSTFPYYIKFAYVMRPKNWYLLSEDEKIKEGIYYQYNTKEIIRILNKILQNKRLTLIQSKFIEQLFYNFLEYEKEYYEINQENLFIDLSSCPF